MSHHSGCIGRLALIPQNAHGRTKQISHRGVWPLGTVPARESVCRELTDSRPTELDMSRIRAGCSDMHAQTSRNCRASGRCGPNGTQRLYLMDYFKRTRIIASAMVHSSVVRSVVHMHQQLLFRERTYRRTPLVNPAPQPHYGHMLIHKLPASACSRSGFCVFTR